MSFADLQTKLNQTRVDRESLELELFAAREKLARIQREKQQQARVSPERQPELEKEERATQSRIARVTASLTKAKQLEAAGLEQFIGFTDPRTNLAQLSDRTPILLVPLRIETRFKTIVTEAGGGQDQLWVRVYPDDIAVDAFEPLLSESELANAAIYSAAIAAAGDDEGQQRAAWRALVSAHGSGRAYWITQTYQSNGATPDTKLGGWTQAPKTNILPERLVLMAFNEGQEAPAIEAIGHPIPANLALGPDPSLDESEQIQIKDGNLVVNDALKWMVDFDAAVAQGMGFRIALTPAQARRGFDKLYVLGVRMTADSANGQALLETLINHHHFSRKGFSLLPQGVPTNNTEKEGAGYSWKEDPDVSFDQYFRSATLADPLDVDNKNDGRTLAEWLGIKPEVLQPVAYYYHTDQREARAMNKALWPGTLGYFLESMMAPVFGEETLRQTRDFFVRFVSGRGPAPAFRAGKQPYGVLPATPFRRMAWMKRLEQVDYLSRLYNVLNRMASDWETMTADVSRVGKPGDPHQLLLDIVGLNASSVEFYSRNAQSFEQWFNTMKLEGFGGAIIALLIAGGYVQSGKDLLAQFGYVIGDTDKDTPDILRKFFFDRGDLLKGPVVDDVPLSETKTVRPYTTDGRNYIAWLADAARTSHDALRRQQGFKDDKTPAALLYLMLQHALDLGYVDTGLRLQVSKNILTTEQASQARQEPNFIHIQQQNGAGSRWKALYQTDTRITGSATQLIGEYIPSILQVSDDASQLREQLQALDLLKTVPTARLERIFAEHLDACSYRLDAWLQGLVHCQLATMRNVQQSPQTDVTQKGVYLGAYGWLENIRPEHKVLQPAQLDPDLQPIFEDPAHPLMSDSTNGGYIHAPSVNHAVTAAILRNGYLENASAANPGSFAVNLSSDRVRLALGIIEGMQGGQSLSALLGYRLERGLHDRHDVEVDSIIYDLRLAFPLQSNRLASTKLDNLDSIDKVEARNVVDAVALIEQIEKTGNAHYPFGSAKLPDSLSSAQKAAIDEEVQRILNINDAVADLAMAESVHQAVLGNDDRAAATAEAYSKGNFPPIPEVIKTPRSGVTLTHRVGLQLEGGLDPADAANRTPRSQAEPALNQWLGDALPDLDQLACTVEFSVTGGASESHVITFDLLGLLPIDLLYMANLESSQNMSSIEDAIIFYAREHFLPALGSDITIAFTETIPGKISLHEAAPLLRSLKALVLRSRALNPGDVALANETSREATGQNIALNAARITLTSDVLDAIRSDLKTYQTHIEGLLAANDATVIVPELDALAEDLAALLQRASFFGLPQTGSGFLWQWEQTQFRAIALRLNALAQRMQDKLDQFDAFMGQYASLTTDEERYTLLQTAERLISTTRTDITAISPDAFHTDLLNNKRPAFSQQMGDTLDALESDTMTHFYQRIGNLLAALPDFDDVPFSMKDEYDLLLVFAQDMQARAKGLGDDMDERLAAVATLVAQSGAAPTAPEKVNALLAAGKKLFSDDFKIITEFALTADQGTEWQNSYQDQAQLLSYQTETLAEDFPLDNWLYGVARVREKIGHLEKAILFAESLADKTLALEPVQLPYRSSDSWLALEYPQRQADGKDFVINEDKLLYTAIYAAPFDSGKNQCGLLLDEWTEIIPGKNETTGLAFHYDRPNSEPPQTLLLATPAAFTGQWQWADLVDTLHDTLDLARKRAAEPDIVDKTAYARFLPALVSAFTVRPITASLNLALNNEFFLIKD
jgi:hypothetical protein